MTDRLYYTDPKLLEFDARIVAAREHAGRPALILDRTSFYPTSGGQLFDTGVLDANGTRAAVTDVIEDESGEVLHMTTTPFPAGTAVHGSIDALRRRDHMQQHTGQHLLSAVFIKLFNAPTVSFHMGDESCTIDLDIRSLTDGQVRQAEQRANQVVTQNRAVDVRWATAEEARSLGVRKIPPGIDKPRLISIEGYDLTACGGTHIDRTGEIGAILLRKIEKVKQGMRVEFVCGDRAVAAARRDFAVLTESAAMLSSHIYDVPAQVRKALEESKAAGKRQFKILEELAELMAERMLASAEERGGVRIVQRVFNDRDLVFIKLLAQKITTQPNAAALLASTVEPTALVFAQSPGGRSDMGALMKQAVAELGGRGGGTRDMAQGGAPPAADVSSLLQRMAAAL